MRASLLAAVAAIGFGQMPPSMEVPASSSGIPRRTRSRLAGKPQPAAGSKLARRAAAGTVGMARLR